MAIRPRGNGFEVDIKYKGKRYFRKTFQSRDYAERVHEEARAKITTAIKLGIEPEPYVPVPEATLKETFGIAIERAFNQRWKGKATAVPKRHYIELLKDYFGPNRTLDSISTRDINDLITHLTDDRGIIGRTINHWLSIIKITFDVAAEEGYQGPRPVIKKDRSKGRRDKFYTEQEEEQILNFMRDTQHVEMYHYYCMLFDTGIRTGSLRLINVLEDIDKTELNTPVIRVRSSREKTKKGRTLPLTQRSREIVEHYQKAGIATPFAHISGQRVYLAWKKYRKLYNITDTDSVTHSIRHTVATRLLSKGNDFRTVQEWMGFSNEKMLEIYAHVVGDAKQGAMLSLEQRQGESEHSSAFKANLRVVK